MKEDWKEKVGEIIVFMDLMKSDEKILKEFLMNEKKNVEKKKDKDEEMNVDGIGFIFIINNKSINNRIWEI